MLRRLSTFATLVSLVVFVSIVAAWISGRPYPTVYAGTRNTSHWQVEFSRGRLVIARFRVIFHLTRGLSHDLLSRALDLYAMDPAVLLDPPSITNGFGFSHGRWHGAESDNNAIVNGVDIDVIGIPYWPLALAASALPALWLLRRMRRAARARAVAQCLCPTCGYDLRATPQRCPECGAVPVPLALIR